MRAIVTPDDLKKGELVDPGWHPAEIADYEEKDAATDNSTNCILKFKIIGGKFEGYSANRLFNEKAMGFGKALWAVLGFPFDEKTGYVITTEMLQGSVGRKLMIYIKRGKSNKGNEFNDVQDFRPLDA